MGLRVELEPLTECKPNQRGPIISRLYNANAPRLRTDFPHLGELYGTPKDAIETIKNRQAQMHQELGFTVCTVVLGWEPDNDREQSLPMRIAGMASHNPHDLPAAKGERLPGKPGLHLAMWLDINRPPQLKRAGVAIMHARIDHMVDNPATEGRPWTVILPSNTASRRVWEHNGYKGGGYEMSGPPKIYPSIDIKKERILYVARFTLDELRAQEQTEA